ncbi:MAG: hypothetical protein AB7F75_01200 [Planctomycetota bacterium]
MAMKIWKLTPSNQNHNNWRASTHYGEVIIRAEDELSARARASMGFGIAAPMVFGKPVPYFPWDDLSLVTCEVLHSREWSIDGDEEILVPAEAELDLKSRGV